MNRDFLAENHRLALAAIGFPVNFFAVPPQNNFGKFTGVLDADAAMAEGAG
jgi:hypothetical protein